ncbi:MAG TPA: ROK family protein [Sorangium sp.]|nr:ROK family protein [Sorangium sp.]
MSNTAGARTLTIDIGGTGTKMIQLDAAGNALGERLRQLTPRPATPTAVLAVIEQMLPQQSGYARVSVGFPGVVLAGVTKTAPNLGTQHWRDVDLAAAITALCGKPARVINDADLQGYGAIRGVGVELALTLGTGLGAGLYVDGVLVPNLELGHHPYGNGKTYEQRVSDAALKRIGKKRFRKRVLKMLAQLQPFINYERIFIGGGNAKKLHASALPANAHIFTNVEGMRGGARLWRGGSR